MTPEPSEPDIVLCDASRVLPFAVLTDRASEYA